jgi:hypothetical protein
VITAELIGGPADGMEYALPNEQVILWVDTLVHSLDAPVPQKVAYLRHKEPKAPGVYRYTYVPPKRDEV